MRKSIKHSKGFSITRYWVRSRPGSVLILVIALLVLLALIGTAYLSSTQTERYTSGQNTVNTQADLLIDGLVYNVEGKITNGLYGTGASSGVFRAPGQENTATVVAPPALLGSGYNTFTSPAYEDFLADRVPVISPATGVPTWTSISWPPFSDSATNPNYSFDSPFATSSQAPTAMYSLINKPNIVSIPTYKTINGQQYPAMLYYVLPNTTIYYSPANNSSVPASYNTKGGYLYASTNANPASANPGQIAFKEVGTFLGGTPVPAPAIIVSSPDTYAPLLNFAASASGDGVADAGMFKVPTGPIDGITYYAAVRVIDNNSAVNVSTAWSAAVDPSITSPTEPLADPVANTANYGFFRSNIGLREMLNTPVGNTPTEMDYLNYYRFNDGALTASPSPVNPSPSPVLVALGPKPLQDSTTGTTTTVTTRSDFQWFSIDGTALLAGDQLETQLARRPLNPGYRVTGNRFLYMDKTQSAALASRFSLVNPSGAVSAIEQLLPYETVYDRNKSATAGTFPSTPYAPSQVGNSFKNSPATSHGTWYGDLFDYHQFNNYPADTTVTTPERTILTASNPVSNGIPSRMGNANTGPAVYSMGNTYNFGDWVTYTDPVLLLADQTHPGDATHTFVCLQPILTKTGKDIKNVSTVPPTVSTRVLTNQYWALTPFSSQPSKVSINTGTFEQLWLGFCQVMTDSVEQPGSANEKTGTATVPQWQPPLMSSKIPSYATGNYGEEQIPQFRSVIRDNRSWPLSNTSNYGQPSSPGNTNSALKRTVAYSNTPGGRVQLTPMQMVQLRAAIAAINTVSIRNTSAGVAPLAPVGNTGPGNTAPVRMTRSRRLILPDTQGNPAFEVEVFGNDIQPFINQMYGYVSDPTNANSFMALQLINPDTSADMTLGTSWAFATIDRTAVSTQGVGYANLALTLVSKGQATFIIPKATVLNGVVVPGYATFYDGTPPSGFTLPTKNAYEVSGLATSIGKELIILRPRKSSGVASKLAPSAQSAFFDKYDETLNLYDLVPVDQIDMTNANNVPTATNNLYYRRAADPSPTGVTTGTSAWNFTWPGFYTPYNLNNTLPAQSKTTPPGYTPTSVANYSTYPLHQPIVVSARMPTPGSATSVTPAVSTANPDFTSLCSGPADTTAALGYAPTFSTVTLQLANTSFPGINPVSTSTGQNRFPFGGFARNVDMLQIPYIGAYRIIGYYQQLDDATANPTHSFYEMNSVTMDASLANDTTLQPSVAVAAGTYPKQVVSMGAADKADGPFVEQIGHFCPIGDTGASTYVYPPDPTAPPVYDRQLDFGTAVTVPPTDPAMYWHYHWTKKLFDYFTVQAPNDDYLPNGADPDVAYPYYNVAKPKYPGGGLTTPVAPVQNVGSSSASANTLNPANIGEDLVGVEGLININTAPWPVLATLPFVPRYASNNGTIKTDKITYTGLGSIPTAFPDTVDDNVNIAQAIADYRAVNGPFKSIYDLYNVPAFRIANDSLLASEPGSAQGDFSPGGINPTTPVSDGARYDFEERFLLLNRISNLITTRSDTFTCYVDLQGWRNVGTGTPTLAVERRRAFIFDRNAYAPGYKNPIYFPVPTGN